MADGQEYVAAREPLPEACSCESCQDAAWPQAKGHDAASGYEEALRAIIAVPSRRTLLLNAEARAMYELALGALEGSWGEPYEEAMIRGRS